MRVFCAISSISALVGACPLAAADPPSPAPDPILPPLALGQVVRIGPTAGTGTPTRDYGIGATDLCEFMEFPTELLQICGDSFAGQGVGFGGWFSPVALHVAGDSVDDPDGIRYTGVTGVDKPLLADPTPPGSSQLPAGVVQINRQNYLLVTTTKNLVPASSRLVKAEAGTGRVGPRCPAPRGRRATPAASRRRSAATTILSRLRTRRPAGCTSSPTTSTGPDRRCCIALRPSLSPTDPDGRVGPAGPGGGWNKPPTPLWPDRVGEMSIREIDGKTVLSYFNASTGNMEVRVAYDPTGLGTAPVTTVVQAGDWPDPAESLPPPDDNRLAQPYGGYISPGSTLDEVRVFISQWNTAPRDRAPYRVLQFAVNPFKPWS